MAIALRKATGRWVKILREHEPLCFDCWAGNDENTRLIKTNSDRRTAA
jgi:hypothetical protein